MSKMKADDWLAVLVISLGFLCLIFYPLFRFTGLMDSYSEGQRTGIVTKISKKGFIWKTWEGEMNLGGTRQGSDGIVANIYKFSVTSGAIAEQLKEVAKTSEPVTLHYKQWFISPISEMDTSYDIVKIDKGENNE